MKREIKQKGKTKVLKKQKNKKKDIKKKCCHHLKL
jgi:hypothetical protein